MMHLFIDGSADPKSRMGIGAHLALKEIDATVASYGDKIKKGFQNTSSTKLELETLLWTLEEVRYRDLKIYSDSKNIIELPARRQQLEQSEYLSKSGKRLNHHRLYQRFYKKCDELNLEFIKIRGHSPSSEKTDIESIFSYVDRALRHALRERI